MDGGSVPQKLQLPEGVGSTAQSHHIPFPS